MQRRWCRAGLEGGVIRSWRRTLLTIRFSEKQSGQEKTAKGAENAKGATGFSNFAVLCVTNTFSLNLLHQKTPHIPFLHVKSYTQEDDLLSRPQILLMVLHLYDLCHREGRLTQFEFDHINITIGANDSVDAARMCEHLGVNVVTKEPQHQVKHGMIVLFVVFNSGVTGWLNRISNPCKE